MAPAFLQPKSFWDNWALSDTLSSHVALSFQWVLEHSGLCGNELTGLLSKPEQHFPSPMFLPAC